MRSALLVCALIPLAACLKPGDRDQDSAVLDLGGDGGNPGGGDGGGDDGGGDDGSGGDGGDGGDGGIGGDGPGGGDDTGSGGGGGDSDEDGDGFSVNDGDCDDSDPYVNPWADDDNCDGYDDDCDDWIDEDSSVSDAYEKESDYWLGDLTSKPGASVDPYLFPDDDVDSYQFFLDEGWFDDFYFEVELIAPSGVDLGMEIYFFSEDWNPESESFELLETVDAAGAGGVETYVNDGGWFDDNGGWYAILVWANNRGSCEDTYDLTVTID